MAPERVVGRGEMAWSASAPSVPTPEAQRREVIARAIHEGWHDPQHPGHGVLQPEDYACADRVLARMTAWLIEQAQGRIPKVCPICTVTEMVCPECLGYGHRIMKQARKIARLEDQVTRQRQTIDELGNGLNAVVHARTEQAHPECHPAALCDGSRSECERATWAAAATEPITTVHTAHHSTDYCDGWIAGQDDYRRQLRALAQEKTP